MDVLRIQIVFPALHNGYPIAVAYLYRILASYMKNSGDMLPNVNVREQLESEYGMSLPENVGLMTIEDWESIENMIAPTSDELNLVEETLKKPRHKAKQENVQLIPPEIPPDALD